MVLRGAGSCRTVGGGSCLGCRHVKVRYKRRADIHEAFLSLGCALICWNVVQRCGAADA